MDNIILTPKALTLIEVLQKLRPDLSRSTLVSFAVELIAGETISRIADKLDRQYT